MAAKLTNNQILLNEIISREFGENTQYTKEDEFFEFFAAQQVLKNYDLSDAEIEQGLTGAPLDGGCDGIYTFANGDLVSEDDDVQEKYKKDVKLVLCIVQAKNVASFGEDVLLKWKAVSKNLLELNSSPEDYIGRYDSRVLSAFSLFRNTYIKLIRRSPKLSIEFKYVSKGLAVHSNVQAHANDLQKEVKSLFPSGNVVVECEFITADMLMELTQRQVDNDFFLKLAESPISLSTQQVFITLVNIKDFYHFITNDNNELIKHIFESNVRDYQGHNTVNKEIQETLQKAGAEDFWWLNNGVTIVAAKANLTTGKELAISAPEIVNGLQTSTEIFNYFSDHVDRLTSESRNVLVRIIVPDSDDTRDRIILATNNQSSIPKASLRATDSIHRQIEMYLRNRNLYYDRRKNYYRNQGKKAKQIVSVSFLAQCLMSILLQKPNDARARPSTLLTDDDAYTTLYVTNQNLDAFYMAAYSGKRIEDVLKGASEYSKSVKTDLLFYVLYATIAGIVGSSVISASQLATIDIARLTDEFITERANQVFRLYSELGGNDKVAKGTELIKRIIATLQSDMTKSGPIIDS